MGYRALGNYTTGFMASDLGANTAIGFQALGNATGGYANCGLGYRALYGNTDGVANTAIGYGALANNTTGLDNTAVGAAALSSNTAGVDNVVVGFGTLINLTSGSDNIALGYLAGQSLTAGDENIYIGNGQGGEAVESGTLRIGRRGFQTATYIAGISDTTLAVGSQVLVEIDGHLGVATSSRRFKEDIKAMDTVSEALFSLKPVSFRYKKEIDPAGTPQVGLVAEEVEKVNPNLVVRDKEGKPYSVRYDQVNAMLLNEFLKEHRKVEEQEASINQLRSTASKQEATIAQQQKGIEAVTARLKEQASQIQKVSAQIELNRPAPQMAVDNP